MKTFKIALVTILVLSVLPLGFAQSPTPTPAPTPFLVIPSEQQAAAAPVIKATSILNQIVQMVTSIQNVLDNGVPAQRATAYAPAKDAISGDAIKASLGATNLLKIQTAMAILKASDPAKIQQAADILSAQ